MSSSVAAYARFTYINCSVVENRVRNADRSVTVTAAGGDNAVTFVAAERKEDRRQRAVSQTLTAIKPQPQQ